MDLKCEAKGLPDPQVTWSRNGRLIKNETLVLRQVTKDDSGLYLCKANNVAGEDRMEVNLTVGDDEEMIQTTRKLRFSDVYHSSIRVLPMASITLSVCACVRYYYDTFGRHTRSPLI